MQSAITPPVDGIATRPACPVTRPRDAGTRTLRAMHTNEILAMRDGLPTLPEAELDELADLVLRLHQRNAQRNRAVLTADMLRPYAVRSDVERAGMRSAVQHVMHALILREVVRLDP